MRLAFSFFLPLNRFNLIPMPLLRVTARSLRTLHRMLSLTENEGKSYLMETDAIMHQSKPSDQCFEKVLRSQHYPSSDGPVFCGALLLPQTLTPSLGWTVMLPAIFAFLSFELIGKEYLMTPRTISSKSY